MKTVTACHCGMLPQHMKTLFESVKFHRKFSFWKHPISYEIFVFEMLNFKWISLIGLSITYPNFNSLIEPDKFHMKYLLGSARLHMNIGTSLFESTNCHMKNSCLKVLNFIWNSPLRSTQLQINIWIPLLSISRVGSAHVHMNRPVRQYFISNKHLNVPHWKPQISYEFPCLEMPNFIWISLIGLAPFIWNYQISYEIPCLEVANFVRISLV